MTLSFLMRGMVAILLVLSTSATSAQSTFRITQVFSSLDGVWQFVELTESAGLNGQHHLTGLTLTSTTRSGISKQFTFRNDLSGAMATRISSRHRSTCARRPGPAFWISF